MKKPLLFLAIAALSACGAKRDISYLQKRGSEFTLTVKTTPCFGKCAVYDLTIVESGLAVYDGQHFPDTEGEVFKPLPTEELDSIREILSANNFFALDSVYDNASVTDLPSMTIKLELGNGTEHQVRGRYETPAEFDHIAAYFRRLSRRYFHNQ